MAVCTSNLVSGQNLVNPKPSDKTEFKIDVPESATKFSIASYKNVNFQKINTLQLESVGLHPEIYISNTKQGVIIITTTEADNTLKDFCKKLESNPGNFENLMKRDTIVFSSESNKSPSFDFFKASAIKNDYRNAFNYPVGPGSGILWNKLSNDSFTGNTGLGRELYDLIIVLQKK